MKARIDLLELVANVDGRGRKAQGSHYEPISPEAGGYTDSQWNLSVACDLVLTGVSETQDAQVIAEKKAKLASVSASHGYAVTEAVETWASEKRDAIKFRVYRTSRGQEF
jgi:hypothetical protein